MKNISTILVLCVFIFQTPLFATLTLEGPGGEQVVVDSETGYLWYPDPGYFANMNYSEQMAAIAALNTTSYGGRTDWHMAERAEIDTLFEYDENIEFNVVFEATRSEDNGIYARYDQYWLDDPTRLYHYATITFPSPGGGKVPGTQIYSDSYSSGFMGAWVVSVQNTAPVADAGPDQTVELASPAGSEVTLDGSGSYDPDGGDLTYSWTWPDGSATGVAPNVTFTLGDTIVELVVNDGTDDSESAYVIVTVQDTTPPIFVEVPSDITVEQETVDGTVVSFTVTATDNIDLDPTIVCVPPSGSIFPLGTTAVVCTATDDSGNEATASFTVTVEHTTVPVPTPVIVIDLVTDTLWPPNRRMIHVANISASDPGDATLSVVVTSNESIDECDWVWCPGPGRLYLRAERDGYGEGRVYTITVTAGEATATAVVTVPHDQCDDDEGDVDDDGDDGDDDDQDDKKKRGRKRGKKDRDRDEDDEKDRGNKNKNRRGPRRGGRR